MHTFQGGTVNNVIEALEGIGEIWRETLDRGPEASKECTSQPDRGTEPSIGKGRDDRKIPSKAAAKTPEPQSNAVIVATAIEGSDEAGWASPSYVGKRILAAVPDFDPRSYGCRNLSRLAEKSSGFETGRGSSGGMRIRRKAEKRKAPGKTGMRASGKS